MNVITRTIALLTFILPVGVQAAETGDVSFATPDMLYMQQETGLIATIPATQTYQLLDRVQSLKSELQAQKSHAALEVEESRFSGTDALIATLMPGGLLYAAHKKQRHKDAKAELVTLSQQLDNLEEDLDMLKTDSASKTLASAF
ncbi:MAG: hypothetical protein ABW066_13930 [Sedimenticola sp.]